MVQAGLKAGLIGAAIAAVLALIGVVPCLGWLVALLTCFGVPLLYAGVGALSVSLAREEIQAAGQGAATGAIAGVITGFIGGVANTVIGLLGGAIFGSAATTRVWLQMLPEEPRFLFEPLLRLQGAPGVRQSLVVGTTCCLLGIAIAAILGALGGLAFKAVRSPKEPAQVGS